MSIKSAVSILVSCLVALCGCSGGGDDSNAGLGGGACSAFAARTPGDNTQVFNGETCSQTARTPVVAIVPLVSFGGELFIGGFCTGTLVTVDDILTSAHCFVTPLIEYGSALDSFAVVVGGANGEAIDIVDLQVHPFYNGTVGSPYDIAMATLQRVPNPAIGPVPILISQFTEVGQKMSTFGYGTNEEGEIGILKSAEFTIEGFDNGNLLASFESENVSICGGDSGGPVVQVVNGVTTIVGVNSFGLFPGGLQCPDLPALYSGFVDLQYEDILSFIFGYAPDVPVR